MNKPLASFVCVTYKRPHLLNELLYCFLVQDYENKELIIVNDEENVEYVYNDPRVKIVNLKKRFSSLSEKRNFSRALTSGEYMFITDDDDIYYSNHMSKLVMHHINNPEYDIVTNAKAHWSIHNVDIADWDIRVPFNGACIKDEYWLSNGFPNNNSCGEDYDFVKNAKVLFIKNDVATFHYRWGMEVQHISGLGGDGQESYKIAGIINNIKHLRKITLTPILSELTSKYYK